MIVFSTSPQRCSANPQHYFSPVLGAASTDHLSFDDSYIKNEIPNEKEETDTGGAIVIEMFPDGKDDVKTISHKIRKKNRLSSQKIKIH